MKRSSSDTSSLGVGQSSRGMGTGRVPYNERGDSFREEGIMSGSQQRPGSPVASLGLDV
jgi:hypothetical protein